MILEKGKGPVLGKLRTIQLIEADLQLLMRIYIGGRNNRNIENNKRLSKFNYGSRTNYSIETAILEKRLMYDIAIRDGKPMLHNISDLKACYDRQLPNLGCLVQESVGVERKAAKIFAKVLPIMKHHVCTDFGISKDTYGSQTERLGGTGQGNSVSGAICRDTSCLIFKYLEEKQLGAMIKNPISKQIIQRIAIAFVDDTDFYTNGPEYELKMQMIMDIYTKLYEATGGKIQQTKIMFYCWKWIYKNGKQNIIQLNATIVVHGETIKAIDVSQSTRTLGVHLNPAISWKGQFEVMRKKMNTSITKMMNMEINSYQAAMYFNVYMIKTVFFGCGIVELNDKQEKELRRIYEEPMLRKLGLSVKFPRTALYSRRSALGVGLMLPSTLIAMLKIKLYVGNIRKLGHATDSIKMQEDYQEIEAGRNIRLGENPKMRYWKKTWIDEVSEELWKRQATFQTSVEQRKQRTKNKTVMEYAIEYVNLYDKKQDDLWNINYVRMKKGVYLPCELVGANGKQQTSCYSIITEQSPIQWDFNKVLQSEVTKGQRKTWEDFIRWLRTKSIETEWDFEAKWRWEISADREVMSIQTGQEVQTYKRMKQSRNMYERNDHVQRTNDMVGCIGRINNNKSVQVFSIEDKNEREILQTETVQQQFSDAIIENIRTNTAIAATDAAMDGSYIATHWIITTTQQTEKYEGGVKSTKWRSGMIAAGEGIGLLELITKIVKNTRELESGGIIIYNDNKRLINEINREIAKESDCTQEAGAVAAGIRREINNTKINIKIEYASDKPRVNIPFEQQPGTYLMKECDEKAKKACIDLIDGEEMCEIKNVGIASPVIENEIVDKNINVLIREIDAIKNERDAIKEKVHEKHEWVDICARNCFHGGVGVGTLKSVVGYNHYGKRDRLVNNGLADDKCPRCGRVEDWKHVILCESIDDMKSKYVKELKSKMMKLAKHEQDKVVIDLIITDIEVYVKGENDELETTQQLIGMDMLFRGWVVKNWINVNEKQSHLMAKLNKIIVKQSVLCYSKAWVHRNEVLHSAEKYRTHVMDWYNRLVEMIQNGNKPSVKKYVRMQKLDVEKCDTSYIRLWIQTTMKMLKEAKTEKDNDIRNYFSLR